MRKEKHAPPFFRAISGACTFWQAIRVWPHSEIFIGRRPVKMLVGELPKPAGLLDKVSRSPIVCGPLLSLLGLIFTPIRMAEQMVNVRLDRHGLPHFRLGLAVFRIKGLSLFGELPALLFQRIHFRELCPA